MLGLGKWKFFVDTMFFRGDAYLLVSEKDGAYDAAVEVPGMQVPKIDFWGIQQEGSTITGMARTDLLRGKDIAFSCTFDGDRASGFLKVPFLGKIKMSNGVKVG